jgi:carboxymethylenebutenolidase
MYEEDLQLTMPDGVADAVLITPDAATPLPGVLHLPDIGSVREAHRQMARELATEGYAVLMVNPFYRTSRPPMWDFPRKMGEPKTMQRFGELVGPLTVEAQTRDVAAYIDHLDAQAAVRSGLVGVVGYCFCGALAMRTAAARPSQVAAAASFHGAGLYKADDPNSPHLVLPKIAARLCFGHATEDGSMTAEDIRHFEEALAAWDGDYETDTYPAKHGWTVPDNPVFDATQAERAFGKLSELFAETLK